MKRYRFWLTTLAFCWGALFIPLHQSHAQSQQTVQKVERLSKELNLTPQEETQLIPILETEAPKLRAIKSDPSLTNVQKLEQLKAVHDQTDPQVKAILTPEQYEKWQTIRRKELQQAIEKKKAAY